MAGFWETTWLPSVMNWFNQFISGNIFGAVLLSYTDILGLWFYAIVMFMGMTITYMKNQNFTSTIGSGLIISSAAIAFMPTQTLFFIIIMIALGIAFIFYKVGKRVFT